ncbi:hypothetical protein [Hyphobacterium marinum]|uniref:Cyclic di-GMP-binding protein n=1 Tax=Hyphobacterium marinum TaxID=3116574 RepID=A0ABU7M246_9PROT|nr:hypothetical protein [Hyphobacterium sp. Y6023]MEE2567345.1 hypothetical protein [Hyphobacterium sp. Y6023]
MFVRVLGSVFAGILLFFSGLSLAFADMGDRRAEAVTLADIDPGRDTVLIDSDFPVSAITVRLPRHIQPHSALLTIAARPTDGERGELRLRVNGRDIDRDGLPGEPETRFQIDGDILQPGENEFELRVDTASDAGVWLVDGRRSQIRLDYSVAGAIETLDGIDLALSADFARLERIHIANSEQYPTLEVLSAQAVALRSGNVPIFAAADEAHDLAVSFDLAAIDGVTGPEIRLIPGARPELVITGRDAGETIAAARLFAARSFAGVGSVFDVAAALDAPQLGSGRAGMAAEPTDLSLFARHTAPFGAQAGARTAVVLAGLDGETRTAAYSILSRMALASDAAWIYAWYGPTAAAAPEGRHLLVIGPDAARDRDLMDAAPPELRAALRAAAQSGPSRPGLRFAAAAYADAGTGSGAPYGVAAIFADSRDGSRLIATFTAGEGAAFSQAAQSLTRSNLWDALEGRAAIWSPRGVTPFDFDTAGAGSLSIMDRLTGLELHPREAAVLLFSLALLFMLRGIWHRQRRIHSASKDLR